MTLYPSEVIWRVLPGFDGKYEVSNYGGVRSLYCKSGWRHNPMVMSQSKDRDGYRFVTLWKDGKSIGKKIQRAVLETFVGPCPEGHEASHLDGDRSNNLLTNLAWETKERNHARKIEHGTTRRGVRGSRDKLTPEQVHTIRSDNRSYVAIAAEYGMSAGHVRKIKTGKVWAA